MIRLKSKRALRIAMARSRDTDEGIAWMFEMNMLPLDYLRGLASTDPALKDPLERTLEYWKPQQPPITIAFAEVGRALAEHFDSLPVDVLEELFMRIEKGATGSNELL